MIDESELEQLEREIAVAAVHLSKAFNLPKYQLFFDHALDPHGLCHENGEIHVRAVSADGRRILSKATVIDMLTHELAHLVHWNHDNAHKRLNIAMKEWLKRQ